MRDDFVVFILSHGRADKVITLKTLKRAGYTGRWYIVIDNEDKTAERYFENFGREHVIVFDKAAIAQTFDEGDNFQDRRAVIYARNACFGIATDLGIKYFIQLDDDYFNFCYKIDATFDLLNSKVTGGMWRDANCIFEALLRMYESVNCASLCIAQGGDFFGGIDAPAYTEPNYRRKAMNTFICSTSRPFQFIGRVNEDVNTYTSVQNRGTLFLTFPLLAIQQKISQHNSGGMSEMYLDSGTYIKSFYTVMYQPSSVTTQIMQSAHPRLHHRINWANTVPCILSEEYRKS